MSGMPSQVFKNWILNNGRWGQTWPVVGVNILQELQEDTEYPFGNAKVKTGVEQVSLGQGMSHPAPRYLNLTLVLSTHACGQLKIKRFFSLFMYRVIHMGGQQQQNNEHITRTSCWKNTDKKYLYINKRPDRHTSQHLS